MSNLQKITEAQMDALGVCAAPNVLSGTPSANKAIFDRMQRSLIVASYNALIDELNTLGVENLVQHGTDSVKYIRINTDGAIETSADGVTYTVTASSGHKIYDKNGILMAQRNRLKFANCTVSDDGTYTIINGVKGDTGATGATGPQGTQGIQGIQGPRGYVLVPSVDNDGMISWSIQEPSSTVPSSRSIRGPQGIQGIQGATGETGAQGPQGVQGIQGPQGVQGNPGINGADGRSFTIKGMYATLPALMAAHPIGAAGDAWAVGTAASNTIYNWNTETSLWEDVGPIRGPQGPQGEQGPQGVQGEQGSQGETGPQGVQGIQGEQGIQGPEGPEGPRGYPANVNGVSPDASGNITLPVDSAPTAGSGNLVTSGGVATQLAHKVTGLMAYTTLHVAKTGSDLTGDGSEAKPYLTIQKAIDALPKYLGADAYIVVHAGAYEEIPILYQFGGPGSLLLRGAEGETASVKALYGQEIWCYLALWNLTITGEHPNDCSSVLLNSCMHVEINDVTCVQPSSTTQVRYGSIFAAYCHFVSLRNTVISNKQIAVDSVGSTVYLNSTVTGTENVTSIRSGSGWGSYGSIVFKGGASIAGTESTAYGGQIF